MEFIDEAGEIEKLREKIRLNECKDTELIIKLDNKIFQLREENNKLLEENKMLKAKLLYAETELEESSVKPNKRKTRKLRK